TNDIVLFDVSDTSHPIAFNVLACPDPHLRPLVASGVLGTFKKMYGDFWGPRLEHILRNAVLALLDAPGTTLVSLLRLLSDGPFLVTQLQLAAMSRANVLEANRRDFFLFVDEFQNFATDAFAVALSELRKYRCGLTLANQYLDQLDETTRSAVFGNVASIIAFQVGADDAQLLAAQLGGDLPAGDLSSSPPFHAYATVPIARVPTRPF